MSAFLHLQTSSSADVVIVAPAINASAFAVTHEEVKETVASLEAAIGLNPPTNLLDELVTFIEWLSAETLVDIEHMGEPILLAQEYLDATEPTA